MTPGLTIEFPRTSFIVNDGIDTEQKRLVTEVILEGQKTLNHQHLGHVYVLGSTTGYYKIGQTTNLVNRLKKFAVALPFQINLELAIPTWDCVWFEKYFHAYFCEKRVNGEWFGLDKYDLQTLYYYRTSLDDSKLQLLTQFEELCPWLPEFYKEQLGCYNPSPSKRKDILFKFDLNTMADVREKTPFFFEDCFEKNNGYK